MKVIVEVMMVLVVGAVGAMAVAVVEIEEVIVRPRTEIGKLEIKPIGTIESSSDQQRTIEPTKVAEPTKSRPKH